MGTQLFRCTDPACSSGLRKRGPYLFVCRPDIGATRRVLAENIMMRKRIAEELDSILAPPLCRGPDDCARAASIRCRVRGGSAWCVASTPRETPPAPRNGNILQEND